MRGLRVVCVALLTSGVSCAMHETTAAQSTTLFIFANFANPNVTVKINGQTLGQLTRQYSGGIDCASFGAVVTAGAMLRATLELGQTYDIEWSYNDGRSDRDELAVTSDVIDSPCPFEEIGAPVGVPPRS
jgi:hypothetical protein